MGWNGHTDTLYNMGVQYLLAVTFEKMRLRFPRFAFSETLGPFQRNTKSDGGFQKFTWSKRTPISERTRGRVDLII